MLQYFLVAWSDEIFAADSRVVHDVQCLTRIDVVVKPRARNWTSVDGNRRSKGTSVTKNRFEAYACGHKTRFADRRRTTGQTVGPLPLGWC